MAQQTKKKLLIAQLNNKLSEVNEQQLERAISGYFQSLREEVLSNLELYWNDYQLMQGQINLITAPILSSHEEYYHILEKHDKKEFQYGEEEAKRLITHITNYSEKSIRKRIKGYIKRKDDLFGTLKYSEEDLLQKVFIASKQTLSRVTKDINALITKGYTDGKGINVVSNMLTRRFDQLQTWEAKRIARTEIHNAHNRGVMKTYDELGVEYTQWIAIDDGRARDSHLDINGEIIRLGDKYSNGLEYPGDESGDIEEWINCRCSNAPFIIPYGKAAPPGMTQFKEDDLIDVKTKF